VAEAYNLPVVPHLATEVMVHAVAAAPKWLTVEHMPWTFQLFTDEPNVEDGEIVLSDMPGLGIEFDDAKLDHYEVAG
jgi:L-alanine-DL-glutamate epimerase-like enolase superfamily enzyme